MALQQVIAQQGRPWEIRMVNLQEQLDNLDIFRRITGIRLQDYYNLLLKKGWTLGSSELLKGLHVVIRLFQPALVGMFRVFGRADHPADSVVRSMYLIRAEMTRSMRTRHSLPES